MQNKHSQAKVHFRHELELHPDEGYVVRLYAGFLHGHGDNEEARNVLSTYLKNDPTDTIAAQQLASIEATVSLPDAIATLRRTNEVLPNDESVRSALGEYLMANHDFAEAAALAHKMLNDAGDRALALNDAAYLLAESSDELLLAEQQSRKSLAILDKETASATIGEANEESFRRSGQLVASWDTLGFILQRESKLDEAQDYLEAAWQNSHSPEVGVHYGKLLEVLGDSKGALRIYHLARRPGTGNRPWTLQQVDAGIDRLVSAGVQWKGNSNAEALFQEERTFRLKVKTPPQSFWSSILRLQLCAGEIQAVLHVSGEPVQGDIEESIKRLKIPHLVPSHSSGRLLRDAVLTCSPGQTECFLVLMPMGSIAAERTITVKRTDN
jgi:tetratricopeptide (TPR) repeat protein